MAWDDGDKGNPWRSDKDKGPADLDAVVRDLQRKLAGLFRGGGGGGRGGSGDQGLSSGLAASALVIIALVWASFGFYRVDAAERGVEFRFGAFQGLTSPGLQWHLPWPIERAEKINTGATEPLNYRASMLTMDENIVNVALVVQFRRTDPQSFMFNLRDPEATLEAATASAIREVIGRNVLDFILTDGRAEVSQQAQDLLQATLELVRSRDHHLRSQLGRRRIPDRGRGGRAGFDPRPRRPRATHRRSFDLLERHSPASAR